MLFYIIISVLILCLSALFSGSETSIFKLDEIDLYEMKSLPFHRLVFYFLKVSSTFLVVILLGNNAVNILFTTFVEYSFFENFPPQYTFLIPLVILVVLLFVGEIIPKILAIQNPRKFSIIASVLIFPFYVLFFPVAYIISKTLDFFISKLQNTSSKYVSNQFHLKALKNIVKDSDFLDLEEKEAISNMLLFANRTVESVFTPRPKIQSIDEDTALIEVLDLAKQTNHTRIPVYKNSNENILGIIDIDDLLLLSDEEMEQKTPLDLLKEVYYIPITKLLSSLLQDFYEKELDISVVIDEYGNALGICTMNDLLSDIIGEIIGEEFEQNLIYPLSETRFLVDSDILLEEFNDYFHTKLVSEDYDTLVGFFMEQIEDVPHLSSFVKINNLLIRVQEMNENWVEKFIIEILND